MSGIQEANCKIKLTITNTKYNVNLKFRNNVFNLKSVKAKIKKS